MLALAGMVVDNAVIVYWR